jgi:hypothetical protein
MINPVDLVALIVVGGSAIAITARNGHVVALGLLIALAAAPLVATPLPQSTTAAARILGALLSAYLLWAVTRTGPVNSEGSAIGLVAELAAGAVAYIVGLQITPMDELIGPVSAQAAGLAILVLAVVPLTSQDPFRLSLGVILLTLAMSLFVAAWAGQTAPLLQLAITGTMVGVSASGSALIARTRGLERERRTERGDGRAREEFTPEPGEEQA